SHGPQFRDDSIPLSKCRWRIRRRTAIRQGVPFYALAFLPDSSFLTKDLQRLTNLFLRQLRRMGNGRNRLPHVCQYSEDRVVNTGPARGLRMLNDLVLRIVQFYYQLLRRLLLIATLSPQDPLILLACYPIEEQRLVYYAEQR